MDEQYNVKGDSILMKSINHFAKLAGNENRKCKFIEIMKRLAFGGCLLLMGCFGGPKQGAVAVSAEADTTSRAVAVAVESPVRHIDINGDGVVDTVAIIDNVGSQFSGKVVEISDGKQSYSAENTEREDAVVAMFYTDIADEKIRDTVYKLLLPAKVCAELDPVGRWIIDAQKSRRNVENNYFDFVSKPRLCWQSDIKIEADSYCVKIDPSQAVKLGKLRESLEGIAAPNITQSRNAWWVCRKTTPLAEPLKEVATFNGSKIYASSAAVAIGKAGKFAWLFINDCYASGARGSIDNVTVEQSRYLIVSFTSGAPSNTYIIDTQVGSFAKLRKTAADIEQNPTIINKIISEFNKL